VELERISAEYEDQNVSVVEVNSAMTSQAELWAWVDGYDYDSLRIEPATQIVDDYNKTQLLDVKVYVLIDLTTMKVINNDCGDTFEGGEQCIVDNL